MENIEIFNAKFLLKNKNRLLIKNYCEKQALIKVRGL